MSIFNAIFGGGDTKVMPDPGTLAWAQKYRDYASQFANANFAQPNFGLPQGQFGAEDISRYMNPFTQQVIQGMSPIFNQQRAQAIQSATDQAIGAHAFGGSRSGILQAMALQGVNQNEAQLGAQLGLQGWQSSLDQLNADRASQMAQQQQVFNILNGGFQGAGQITSSPTNILGTLAGAGAAGLGIYKAIG